MYSVHVVCVHDNARGVGIILKLLSVTYVGCESQKGISFLDIETQ